MNLTDRAAEALFDAFDTDDFAEALLEVVDPDVFENVHIWPFASGTGVLIQFEDLNGGWHGFHVLIKPVGDG